MAMMQCCQSVLDFVRASADAGGKGGTEASISAHLQSRPRVVGDVLMAPLAGGCSVSQSKSMLVLRPTLRECICVLCVVHVLMFGAVRTDVP